jgi:chemotaxis protein MotA
LDLATIIGLLAAFGAVALSAFIGNVDARILFERYEAFILVFGGTVGATLTSFPMRTFLNGVKTGFSTAFRPPALHEREIVGQLVSFAERARREGLLALEQDANELDDEFLRKGIQLVIDGRDTDIIRKILETEVSFVAERGAKAEAVFMAMGGFSPTLGIIGTVLGLIAMLKGLGSMGSSGGGTGSIGMATAQAFVATFYGILLANLVWLPIGGKIKQRNEQLLMLREIMIEGILAIQAGDNPRLLEEKLLAFLDPADREKATDEGAGAAAAAEPSFQS